MNEPRSPRQDVARGVWLRLLAAFVALAVGAAAVVIAVVLVRSALS